MLNLVPIFILKNYNNKIFHGNFKAVTLFQDISGFTAMTEKLMKQGKVGAEILSFIINQLFEILISIIYKNGGFISTFAGDAFTAIFPLGDIAKTCKVALDIQKYFIENPIKKTALGEFNLSIKQGISYGRVDWGIVGGEDYKSFYFRGEAIDGCAISEHHSDKGEIIIDSRILEQLSQENITFTEKTAYYYLLEEKNFQAINWDKFDTLEPISHQEDENNEQLKLIYQDLITQFFPTLHRGEKLKAEFRDLVSVFLSFEEPDNFEKLNIIMKKILRLTKDFGGYLSSLDFGDKGSVMLFLFGAPIAYEDNILRAADFATNIKSLFKNKIALGITSGIAFAGYVGSSERITYTALGDVVNLSARFMSTAKDGQLLISQKISTAIEREFKTNFIGKKSFKGKTEEIKVYEIIEKIYFEDEGLHTGNFVGRKKEFNELNQLCKPFFNKKFSGFIYIYGAAGIGKSRLLFEFTNPLIANQKDKATLIVLQTNGILKKSLNPFITYFLEFFNISHTISQEQQKIIFDQKFKKLLNSVPFKKNKSKNQEIKEVINYLQTHKSILGGFLEIYWKNSLYSELDSTSRFTLFLSVIKYFFILQSYVQPLIIVLEDAYEIDKDSKEAFDLMIEDIHEIPLVIFASCRLNDDDTQPQFLQRNKHLTKKIIIPFLSNSEGEELIQSLLGKKIHLDLLNFIIEKTENNPLYIEEFCNYLLKKKLIEEIDGKYVLIIKNSDIPEGIGAIMISRLDRLSINLKEVVQMASILGRDFNIHILGQLLHKEEEELKSLLQEGIKQNLWIKLNESYYQFVQLMIQNTAYSMQLTEDLKIIHKQVGELLEKYYHNNITKSANIAYHFELAQVNQKAIKYFTIASKAAHESYRSNEALELYEKLLTIIDKNEERVNIYARMAEINELKGSWDNAQKLLNQSIDLSIKIKAELKTASLKAYQGAIFQKQGEITNAHKVLKQAIKLAKIYDDQYVLCKSHLNLGKVYLHVNNLNRAMQCFKRAYSTTVRSKEKIYRGLSLYYMGVVKRTQNIFDSAIKYYQKSNKVFQEAHNKRYKSYPIYDLALIYQYQGKLKKSEKLFNNCIVLYREIDYSSGESSTLLNLSIIYLFWSDYDKALKTLYDALKISRRINEKMATSYILFILGTIFYHKKDYKKNIEYLKQSLDIMQQIKVQGYYGYVLSYLTCTYAKLNKPNQAIKAAYYHLKNMKKVENDVENGRTYMGIAMALASPSNLSPIAKERLSEISNFAKIDKQEKNTEAYFERAIKIAQSKNYINTLIPALYLYSQYLMDTGALVKARQHMRNAQKKAQEYGYTIYLKKIEEIKKKIEIISFSNYKTTIT